MDLSLYSVVQSLKRPVGVFGEPEQEGMEGDERRAMGDGEEGDAAHLTLLVETGLCLQWEGGGGFVEHRECGLVEEHAGECQPLFLARGQEVRPVHQGVKLVLWGAVVVVVLGSDIIEPNFRTGEQVGELHGAHEISDHLTGDGGL